MKAEGRVNWSKGGGGNRMLRAGMRGDYLQMIFCGVPIEPTMEGQFR